MSKKQENIYGETQESLKVFAKAIELKADYYGNYQDREWVLYDQGKYDKAIVDFDKVIELNPQYSRSYNMKGWYVYELKKYKKQ